MEYRQLGGSGLKVPILTLGTGTFGGSTDFFKPWGAVGVPEATRLVDVCLDAGLTMFDTADVYSGGQAEEILGKAIAGRRDRVLISTKATFRSGDGPNDVGSSRLHHHSRRRRQPAAARHRLHRSLPAARLRCADAGRGSARHARRAGARRQDPLHRRLEFLGLASDEVAGRLGEVRARALRRPPGVLLADRPRVRVGADAARARSEGRGGRVEPARLGPADRQDPPRAAAARAVSRLQIPRNVEAGPPVSDEHLYTVVDALDAVAAETGKTVPQIALNWLLQRPTVSTLVIGARNEEQLRQNLGAVGWKLTAGADRPSRRRQRGHPDLSLLAPAGLRGAQSVPDGVIRSACLLNRKDTRSGDASEALLSLHFETLRPRGLVVQEHLDLVLAGGPAVRLRDVELGPLAARGRDRARRFVDRLAVFERPPGAERGARRRSVRRH